MPTIGSNVSLHDDTVLGEGVTVGNNVTFYPGVTLGDGTRVFDGAVLGRPPVSAGTLNRKVGGGPTLLTVGAGCVIGANAVLYHGTAIGDRVLVGDLASVREGCTLADGSVIGRNVLVMYDTT